MARFFLSIACIVFFSAAWSVGANRLFPNVPALFIFGDSIVDSGNNDRLFTLARADYPPYGENFVNHLPTGRFTDGELAVDYLASFLGLPFVPPYLSAGDNILQGANFASASSGILDATGDIWGERLPLAEQIELFKDMRANLLRRLGREVASLLISRSVFIIATGSNDYLSHYHASSVVNPTSEGYITSTFQDNLLERFTGQLVSLYELGARKIAVVSIPAVGCLPAQLYRSNSTDGACVTTLNQAVQRYNAVLEETLKKLQATLDGSHFVYCDSFDLILHLSQNASHFGFREGKTACCGSGSYNGESPCLTFITRVCENASDHVFWDFAHPTSAAYRMIADTLWQGSQRHVRPINLHALATV